MSENIETLAFTNKWNDELIFEELDSENTITINAEIDMKNNYFFLTIDEAKQLITFLNKQIENGNQKTN